MLNKYVEINIILFYRERMAQRIAREQAERSPALQLDIPAELAFIFSKLDAWQPPHTERNLVKVLGSVVGPPPVQAPSLSDLGQYTFGKFSSASIKYSANWP